MENDRENADPDQEEPRAGGTNGPSNFVGNEVPCSPPSSTNGFKSISARHGLVSETEIQLPKTSQDYRVCVTVTLFHT